MSSNSASALSRCNNASVPADATAAVLKASDPIAEGAREVKGINFDDFAGREITVSELVIGMTNMGFQASAVGEAVRIINDMVCSYQPSLQKPTETLLLASLERCGDWSQNDDLPGLHFQSDLIRPSRHSSLPRPAQACFRHRHHCWWS